MASVLPRLPSEVAIFRVRRKTRGGVAGKESRLYTVRAKKVIEALDWLNARNPYYKDVAAGHSRIVGIPEGSEIPFAVEMNPEGGFLPDDIGPAPRQNEVGADASDAGYETGGMLLPAVAPNYREDVRKLIAPAPDQNDSGRKYVDFHWPAVSPGPVSEFRTMVSYAWPFRGSSPDALVASLAIAHTWGV